MNIAKQTKDFLPTIALGMGILSELALPKACATNDTQSFLALKAGRAIPVQLEKIKPGMQSLEEAQCTTNSVFDGITERSLTNALGGVAIGVYPPDAVRPNYTSGTVVFPFTLTGTPQQFDAYIFASRINPNAGSNRIDAGVNALTNFTFQFGVHTNSPAGATNNPPNPDLKLSRTFTTAEYIPVGIVTDQTGTNYTVSKVSLRLDELTALSSNTNKLWGTFNAIAKIADATTVRVLLLSKQEGDQACFVTSSGSPTLKETPGTPAVRVSQSVCEAAPTEIFVRSIVNADSTITIACDPLDPQAKLEETTDFTNWTRLETPSITVNPHEGGQQKYYRAVIP